MNFANFSAIKTQPRKVELLKGDDFKCALLGSLGFSTKLIMQHTDLTPGQVGYRLRKGNIRRTDYRNGESAVASALLNKARVIALPTVKEHLRNVLENQRLLNS